MLSVCFNYSVGDIIKDIHCNCNMNMKTSDINYKNGMDPNRAGVEISTLGISFNWYNNSTCNDFNIDIVILISCVTISR